MGHGERNEKHEFCNRPIFERAKNPFSGRWLRFESLIGIRVGIALENSGSDPRCFQNLIDKQFPT